MAIEDHQKLTLSRRVATVWVVIAMGVAIIIGVVGNAMTAAGALETLADPETIIVKIAGLLSTYGIVPALLAGIILAGILASTMSTADSQLLAASSSVSENLFKGVFHIKVSNAMTMVVARATLVVIGLVGIIIAWDPNSSVFGIGHGAVALFLMRHGVDTVICGGIGGGAKAALAGAGIRLYGGVTGEADAAVATLLAGALGYDPEARCGHHDRAEGHACGTHSCGHHDCH